MLDPVPMTPIPPPDHAASFRPALDRAPQEAAVEFAKRDTRHRDRLLNRDPQAGTAATVRIVPLGHRKALKITTEVIDLPTP